jgi:hypothetical protein
MLSSDEIREGLSSRNIAFRFGDIEKILNKKSMTGEITQFINCSQNTLWELEDTKDT